MERKNKENLLFIYKKRNTFVVQDINILQKDYNLKDIAFYPFSSSFHIMMNLLKQFFFLVFWGWKYKKMFIWFADYHAFLPVLFAKLFHKSVFVVNGGYDVNFSTEFNYGAVKHPIRAKLVKFVLSNATYCIPVTKELIPAILRISSKANIKTIPTGYVVEDWHYKEGERKYFAVTVSITNDKERYLVKGIDRFIELANAMPDKLFLMVGTTKEFLSHLTNVPSNLEVCSHVTHKELNNIYQNSLYYAQLSRSEGLPSTICEAMLCGSIPVAMNVGGVANLVENHGILLQEWNTAETIKLLTENSYKEEQRRKNRDFIVTNYSIDKRYNDLMSIM
ncbi:glycosyltransferase [Maribellus sediminis]|uniref:glycosyltransferase n=1 Tax=Maribellus sediminis TaxID=2696285 RepID=UPI0014310F66|nr:glycosyltransferase [Maribellus sediminis]